MTLFSNNSVQNCATGLWMDFAKVYNTATAGYMVSSNTITATTSTLSTTYANVGAYFQQGGTTNGAVSGVQLNTFEIVGNTITNMAKNCIYANSVNNSTSTGFFDVQQNTELSVLANTYTAVQNPQPNAAVLFTNCWSSRCSDNSLIHTVGYSGTSIPHNQFVAGVYSSQSPKTSVNCNTIQNIGECFVWESTSPSYTVNGSSFQKNAADYSMYGLVLRNTGVMGDQGSSTNPITATWGTGNSTHWWTGGQTLADGSFPATSPYSRLYESSAATCTVTPCLNQIFNGGSAYSVGSSLLSASGINNLACASNGGGGGGGGAGRMASVQIDTTAMQDSLAALYTNMLTNVGSLPAYDYETRWAMHHHIHSMMPNINVNTNGYANAQALAAVEVKLAAGKYNLAQGLLNNITPTNTLEQNFYTVYGILIGMRTNDLMPGDIADLQVIANQCHLTGGSIVWKARALLNSYYNDILSYPDVCSTVNHTQNRFSNTLGITANAPLNTFDAYVYPNPNIGTEIFIAPVGLTNGNLQIRMTDLEGRTVYENNCAITDGLSNIKMTDIKNGVYFINITNATTGERVVKKLVIQY
jgi:hypothetical protein